MTLLVHHAVDAVLVVAARRVAARVTVAARQRADVSLVDLHVADRTVHLSTQ